MYTIDELKKLPLEERKEILSLIAKLSAKKAQVVEKVKRIPKNGYNSFHKYEYSTESDIKEGIRSILAEAGLTLDIDLIEDEKQEISTKQGKGFLHSVKMQFTLIDNETGYMDVKVSKGEASDNGDKGIYKAYAGCIKYYLMNNFLISTGEKDIDPESGDSEQIFNGGKQNKGNKGGNKGNQGGNQAPKQVTRPTIEAKWKMLNGGSIDGFDAWYDKKTAEGADHNWMDKALLGKVQAKQAADKKAQQEAANEEPGKPDNASPVDSGKEVRDPSITDVKTGNAVTYEGKEVILD